MKSSKTEKRRPTLVVMAKLIVLVKPLLPVMLLAIVLGVAGFLCAIFLTVFASENLVALAEKTSGLIPFSFLIILAVARGLLHYGEQYCNHFIAFELLAIIRHKVFAALRRLCPAKLEGRDKGNLISVITSDIELLEVFYAHTISPVAIALIVSAIMCVFLGKIYIWAGLFAAAAYLTVGFLIPLINSRLGSSKGFEFRNEFGELNSFVLASLRGLDETIQYGLGKSVKIRLKKNHLNLDVFRES